MNAKVLQRPTLVLNRNWQPVNVATVARALVLLWNEAARIVDAADYQTFSWDDWSKLRPRDGEAFVQAMRFRLRVPEVVALTRLRPSAGLGRDVQPAEHFQARPVRLPVLRHPAGHARNLTIDHVVPRSQGGVSSWDELRAGMHGLQQAEGRPHAASRPA